MRAVSVALIPQVTSRRSLVTAIAADLAAVLVFVVVGRSSHAEHESLLGVATTAWPFVVGLAAGWCAALAWRAPVAARTGVAVWASTVAIGQVLRLVVGQGSAWSFLVVTMVVLGVLLLGWRAAVGTVIRRRHARDGSEPVATRTGAATGTDPSR